MFRIIGRLYAQEHALFATGLLGVALSVVLLGGIAVRGSVLVTPEGNLFKAASFDGAVGVFVLTLGLIVPLAGLSKLGGLLWRSTLIVFVLFGFAVETIQIARGLDPRFSRVSSQIDQALGGLFFLSAVGIMLLFLVLMGRFFVRPGTPVVVALRYGAVASMLGFGIGIAMSALGSPRVGVGGNLLPLHAAGFHGIQAVPLVALVLGWAGVTREKSMRSVHAAGVLWLALCGGIAWQTFTGRSLWALSQGGVIATVAFSVWTLLFVRALLELKRSGRWPDVLRA